MIPRIYQRGKSSWTVRYDAPPGPGGKRRQRRISVRGSKADAKRVAAEIAAQSARGLLPSDPRMRMKELLSEWLADRKRSVAPRTHAGYRRHIELYIEPSLGHYRLADLRALHIDDALQTWTSGARKDGRKGIRSSTSIHHIFRTLSAALAFAERRDYIGKNPARGVSAPRREDPDQAIVSPQIFHQLLAAISDDTFRIAVTVALGLGVRCGELVALRWRDINWTAGTVYVRQTAYMEDGQVRYKMPKTRRSRRTIAAPEFVMRALRIRSQSQATEFESLLLEQNEDAFVFETLGAEWSPDNFSSRFYRLKTKLGLPHRLHDLRHSFASWLLNGGAELIDVRDALGHSTLTTTADIYAHLMPARAAKNARVMDTAFTDV
jgi:integrase